MFQRFVSCIKNAAEQTRQTKRRGDEKSTTSLNPLTGCVNKFSNVLMVCAVCTERQREREREAHHSHTGADGEHYTLISVCRFAVS